MNQGTVKFFNDDKGFGFIKDSNSNQEYFVHVSGLIDEIRENDEVAYELQERRKGLNATNEKLALYFAIKTNCFKSLSSKERLICVLTFALLRQKQLNDPCEVRTGRDLSFHIPDQSHQCCISVSP